MQTAKRWKSAASVASQLRKKSCSKKTWQLRWVPVCASTEKCLSEWLNEQPLKINQPRAFLSARQIKGRGQRGKVWVSPIGGVWISAAMPCEKLEQKPDLFGLSIAVALSERLETKGLRVTIKWPNDLMLGERKLAGLLPKLIHRGNKLSMARIGLGLNVWNRVPSEGVSISQCVERVEHDISTWSAEVILALEDAIVLMNDPYEICIRTQARLWSKYIFDDETGEQLKIKGIARNGGLIVMKGSDEIIWTRA